MAATFDTRIKDLIGDYTTRLDSNHRSDLLNTSIAMVADSVKPELLLKYAKAPQSITDSSGWNSIEGKKVLLVTRLDASGGVDRECQIVSISEFSQAADTDSMYEATAFSPIACYTTSGAVAVLKVLPVPTGTESVNVYYFEYPTSDLTASNDATLNAAGIPDQLFHVIALKTSIVMLQAYMSNAVQDEEDQEIVSIVQAQIASLIQQYELEIARFVGGKPE